MKMIRNLLLASVVMLGMQFAVKAAVPPVISGGIGLSSANVTEVNVVVSTVNVATNTAAGSLVLAANTNRLSFDIMIATCASTTSPTPRIFYSFSSGISTTSATNINTTGAAYPYLTSAATITNTYLTNDPFINYQGPIWMFGESLGCQVAVREYTTTSPVWQ